MIELSRRYLDSNIIIYLIERQDSARNRLIEQLSLIDDAKTRLCASELSRLECRVKPLREQQTALLARYEGFFSNVYVELLPMNRAVYDRAAELRANFDLRVPDALHLATAIIGGCAEFWTNDDRLGAAVGTPLKLVKPTVSLSY